MDEHWQILDLLDRERRYDVRITYNTNLGTLEYKGRNAADYWRRWGQNIKVCPSVDELGERAELIRSGTVWPTVAANLAIVAGLGVKLAPNITVSVFNAFRLPEIIDGLVELGAIDPANPLVGFSLNVVEQPAYYHASVLPLEQRQRIRQRLESYLADFKQRHGGAEIARHFLHLFSHLDAPQPLKQVEKFRKITAELDALRGEKTHETIPELAELLA